jgi:cellulase/cellobiase CelA1
LVERQASEAKLQSIESDNDRLVLLNRIAGLGGTAGLAAKLAVVRHRRAATSTTVAATSPVKPAAHRVEPVHAVHALVSMLGRSLGDEKAREVVTAAMAELHLAGERLSEAEAESVLEQLASREGVVGTVARFAKARFLLK